jgi:CubicO group peptidase (beta-lactamase class C family)
MQSWPIPDWQTADPAAHGFDPRLADKLDHHLRARRAAGLYSLLVIRDGWLVYERYFHGFAAKDAHQIMSVVKSFYSALVGIALRLGLIASLDTPIAHFLPEYSQFQRQPLLQNITIRHVLSMSSGLYWQFGVHGHQPMIHRITACPDWTAAVLDLPLQHKPGTHFLYKEADAILISAVISHATGHSAYDFACQHLFAPLGINTPIWPTDPQGNSHNYAFLGPGAPMTARNLARLGLLYLNAGQWDDREIISPDYIAECTQPSFASSVIGERYGLMWWLHPEYSFASGYGGQTIAVIPQHRVVVVIQADHDRGNPKGYNDVITQAICQRS